MRTCRRQPSTFARSLRSISAVSTLSLMAPPFAFSETNPAARKLATSYPAPAPRRSREQLVHAAGELGEAGLERRPLRVGLGDEGLEAPPKLRLHVAEPPLEGL